MNQITEYPTEQYDFGYEFNYALWTPGTTVTLCNVPWNNDYRDIVKFDSHDKLDEFLAKNSTHTLRINQLTLCKPNVPIRIDAPFNEAFKFNYISVRNNVSPANSQVSRFYYFITDVRYVAPNTTELVIQLDVWQTFCHDVQFGSAYIERGHIGVANSRSFDDYGREFLTVPEGLDMGNEYTIQNVFVRELTSGKSVDYDPTPDNPDGLWDVTPDYSLLVISTTDLEESGGTIDNPILKTAKGTFTIEGMPSGCDYWVFEDVGSFIKYIRFMADKPWVTRGIISVTIIPKINWNRVVNHNPDITDRPLSFPEIAGPVDAFRLTNLETYNYTVNLRSDWRATIQMPARYRHLVKFKTFPYTVVELTSYTGNPLILKPECMPSEDMILNEFVDISYPNPRIVWGPSNYNSRHGTTEKQFIKAASEVEFDSGEFLDMQTGITNFPQVPIVNDSYSMYMASNAHNIAYQYQSADWSQQRAMMGNALAYDQSTANMNLSTLMNSLGITAANQHMDLTNETLVYRGFQEAANAVANGAMGMGGGNIIGGAVGAAIGVANAAANVAISANQNVQSTAINNNLATQQTAAQVGNQGFVRDTNKAFADYAANGDYQNTIAGINAKVQDAKLMQPTTVGQMGGDAFVFSRFGWGVRAKIKTLQPAVMAAIGEYWLRYGYAVNRFVQNLPASLQTMRRFTYWKLRETYLVSSTCPELYKQTIRGIFEKGVTVWANPNDIGRIDLADNEPIFAPYFGGN